MSYDGAFAVAEAQFDNPGWRVVPGTRFETHYEADLEVYRMNRDAITLETMCRVYDSIKKRQRLKTVAPQAPDNSWALLGECL